MQPLPPPPSPFTVVAIAEGGNGRGFDLTDEAEGLSFSNVDPGGDEVCTFTIHRSWFAENPEIAKGNLVRIMGSIDTLFVGRIEDIDRATGDSETLTVTVYGLGNRLGDVTFREIYLDPDLTKWGAIPNPRVVAIGTEFNTAQGNATLQQSSTGFPQIALEFTRLAQTEGTGMAIVETWYDSGGIEIGSVYAAFAGVSAGAVGFGFDFFTCPTQTSIGRVSSPNFSTTVSGTYLLSAAAGSFYSAFQFYYTGTFTGDGLWRVTCGPVVVMGRHGLAGKGTAGLALSPDQIAGHMVGKASGVVLRNVDSFANLIYQFTVTTPTTPKDGLAQVNEYANADYGVWGPDSPLDISINGYFDYTTPEPAAQQWLVTRADFESDLDLHTELSSLYDTVEVHWTATDGSEHTERFSITSPDLQAANLSPRVYPLEAGKTTKEGAQILAEIYLDIFAGFAPARGTGTITRPIRHYRRGKIPPYYLRADGSNMRIPDILPAETTFSLDSTPDRRTTFPIKRVTVDCSGDIAKTSVELDQTTDALSSLLAEEAARSELVG